jgi:pyrophosphatase PpaX
MKHWVFDLDGTLVDSFGHYFDALREIFTLHGATFSSDLHHAALTDHPVTFFQRELGGKVTSQAIAHLQERSNSDAARVQPFPGAMETVRHLTERGSRVAVWTNRDRQSARLILDQTGLAKYADTLVSSCCVTQRKPHPEGLLKLSEVFACRPSEITMVGDHEHDVTAAKSVGARAVRASWHQYWPATPCSTADRQFFEFPDFQQWVQTLHP